jgi:hypothetical protein
MRKPEKAEDVPAVILSARFRLILRSCAASNRARQTVLTSSSLLETTSEFFCHEV